MSEADDPSKKPAKGPWYSTGSSLSLTIGLLVLWSFFVVTQLLMVWIGDGLRWWNALAIASGGFLILLYGINLVRLLRERAKTHDSPAPLP